MWEIYAYHNTDSLVGIFNAIAAIVASSDYLSAIAAVAFCGFVAALIAYMFSPEKLQGWKWIISVVLVYGVLFVPRVTVGVVDKTGGSPVRVVANVPFGMAALGGLTSSIGNTITELVRDGLPDAAGAGSLASRTLLPAERPDVRQPPDPGDTPVPRSRTRASGQISSTSSATARRSTSPMAPSPGGLLVVCRSLDDDGRHEPGTLQHHHRQRRASPRTPATRSTRRSARACQRRSPT